MQFWSKGSLVQNRDWLMTIEAFDERLIADLAEISRASLGVLRRFR
jgi:hypothetical protein